MSAFAASGGLGSEGTAGAVADDGVGAPSAGCVLGVFVVVGAEGGVSFAPADEIRGCSSAK